MEEDMPCPVGEIIDSSAEEEEPEQNENDPYQVEESFEVPIDHDYY
jgi:hypothetical protein